MKFYLAVLLAAFSTNLLFGQIKFTLVGKINADAPKQLTLSFEKKNLNIPISNNGEFSFSAESTHPCMAIIQFGDDTFDELFLDSGEIRLLIEKIVTVENNSEVKTFKIASVNGSETSESNFNINKIRLELYEEFKHLNQIEKADSLKKHLYALLDNFISKYPKSPLSISFIESCGFNYETQQVLFNKLDKNHNKEQVASLSKRIEREKKLAPGNRIDNFSMAKHDGKIFNLNRLDSKYVLLEFWASWCVPCRAMRPHLSTLYEKYHKAGLEIVGISLDDNKVNWVTAIEKDNVPWIEVSDLKGFKSEIAIKYNINAVPFWILVDKNQKIIESGFWTVPEATLKRLIP